MTWLSTLYKTYEKIAELDLPGRDELMPISHTLQNAHINIVIDNEGNFKRAEVLEKKQIVLPATEDSAGRSSGEAPHPLADKLQYVAKDYAKYGGTKKAYFESYQSQLRQWCESEFAHPKAQAVYRYIEKGQVIEDLLQAGIVHVSEEGVLLTRWTYPVTEENPVPLLFKILPKEKGELDQGGALVCWTVVGIENDLSKDTWTDESLQQSWINFEAGNAAKQGFCFVTGSNVPLATNHPAKLRHTGDKAKLISSNDTAGYTYRGKFIDNGEACGVSFEVTQKAHNALRWLISRPQAYRNGEQVILAWAISGKKIPSPLWSSTKLLGSDLDEENESPQDKQSDESIDHGRNLGAEFASRLKKKLKGYRAELGDYESIIFLGLDSATPGRMAITYYRESNAKEFIEKLEEWHSDFAWPQRNTRDLPVEGSKKPKKQVVWLVSTPTLKAIAEAAYGTTLKDSLKKSTIERLIPCIVEGQPFPKDLVESCIRNASNPNAYSSDEKWLWQKNISIACALYKGFHSERNPDINERRKYEMSLEKEYRKRDYLYGRLLALAEQIEAYALYKAGEKRVTNAERLMQRFSTHPFTTWQAIDESLNPYRKRLKVSKDAGLLNYWQAEIEQVHSLFQHGDYTNNNPLTGEYLLGYYCQKHYNKSKKTETSETINPTENETNPEEI